MKICPKCKLTYPNERTFYFVNNSDLKSFTDQHIDSTIADRYVLLNILGENSITTVYTAHHTLIKHNYTIKIINPIFTHNTIIHKHFQHKTHSTQKLTHPNIIKIFNQNKTNNNTS